MPEVLVILNVDCVLAPLLRHGVVDEEIDIKLPTDIPAVLGATVHTTVTAFDTILLIELSVKVEGAPVKVLIVPLVTAALVIATALPAVRPKDDGFTVIGIVTDVP